MAELKDTPEEAMLRENLDQKIISFQTQARLGVLETENVRLRKRFNDQKSEMDRQVKVYEARIAEYTKQISKLEKEKEDLTDNTQELEKKILQNQTLFEEKLQETEQTLLQQLTDKNNEIKEQKESLEKLEDTKNKSKDHASAMEKLQKDLDEEKKKHSTNVNRLEREKVIQEEESKVEMLNRIKETKANLLALNEEQLQTTTRLTILQNHQLTTELEYQSKQTEQLLYKNSKMMAQIETLKRDIKIHQEVEKELAKRSHYCQKVIKKLKDQIVEYEQEKQNDKPTVGGLGDNRGSATNRNPTIQRQSDDLINFLEHKLEEMEKKYQRTQIEFESLQSEYHNLQDKLGQSREKYQRAALLLTDFLDDLLNQSPSLLENDRDMHLNLEVIKETPLEKLPREDKVALVLVLLKQLQPYLSVVNLQTGQDKFISNKTDEVLRQHGAQGMASEVEALTSILNNINVQTKKNRANF